MEREKKRYKIMRGGREEGGKGRGSTELLQFVRVCPFEEVIGKERKRGNSQEEKGGKEGDIIFSFYVFGVIYVALDLL